MKKLICILMSILIMGTASFAQSTNAKQTKVKATRQAPAAATDQKAVKTKKDGTPDMRAKENKAAAVKPAQKLKKDGTPDMRYKENKTAAPAAKK
jgi:hypothetical protein